LRDLGVTQPIGFFLHTPWPARAVIGGVPHHRELIEAMLAYDLIGFQTQDDCDNFLDISRGSRPRERRRRRDVALRQIARRGVSDRHRSEKFAEQAAKAVSHPDVSRLRRSLNGEKLAIGVDRLDYSKGLVNRINAFDRMWTTQPSLARTVSLLQIATPSRGAIEAYGNLQNELAKLVSDVNGRHGEVDWTPIRYLNKGFSQTVLAGLYRTAQVGVVTPLHDGMNLVAKEYVAAQKPGRSRRAGAVEIRRRRQRTRHRAAGQSARYRRHGAHHRDRALDAADRAAHALGSDDGQASRRHHPAMVRRFRRRAAGHPDRRACDRRPLIMEPPTLWPLRSVNSSARYH
jgi:trehalose 6-phosphate synthase